MPSVSGPQHRFMGHCVSDPSDPKCPSEKVAREFLHADKGKKFGKSNSSKRMTKR